MRPTCLKFRSPKEETPGFNYPNLTRRGTSLDIKDRAPRGTFSREGRFQHIQEIARRTGFNVGPGAYNFRLTTNKGQAVKIVRDSAIENPTRWDYSYVGDSILKSEKAFPRSGTPNSTFYMNTSYQDRDLNSSQGERKERISFRGKRVTSARPPSHGGKVDYRNGPYLPSNPLRKNKSGGKALNRSTDDRNYLDENEVLSKYFPQIGGERATFGRNREIKEETEGES